MATAEYNVYVDWDKDGGLALSNFEGSADGWYTFGTTPPVLFNKQQFNPAANAAHRLVENFAGPALSPDLWKAAVGTTVISSNSISITATSTESRIQSQARLLSQSYVQAKVVVPVYASGTRYFAFEVKDDDSNYASFLWDTTSASVILRRTKAGVNTDTSISYSNMPYLRFREDEGVLYWETSTNGFVWDAQLSMPHQLQLNNALVTFRAGYTTGSPPVSDMVVSELNTAVWPVYTGSDSLLLDWQAYNPFQFDVAGHGFDQGRFSSTTSSGNSPDVFQFGTAGHGFTQGRFGLSEAVDVSVESPGLRFNLSNLTVGKQYTAKIKTWVPSTNVTNIIFSVVDMAAQAISSLQDEWDNLSLVFTATATNHILEITPTGDPAEADMVWLDQAQLIQDGEIITSRVLARTDLGFARGRDTARSLDNNSAATLDLEVDNQSRDYSPGNLDSPIAGLVGPGKEILLTATFEGVEYPMYRGYVDDFTIAPHLATKSVSLTTVDLLGYLGETKITTELYQGVRTGKAIEVILDALAWPKDRRKVDTGSTVIPFWWVDDSEASSAIEAIQKSEGPPSICYIDGQGNFVFKDRHHRLLDPNSRSSQVNYVQTSLEEEGGVSVAYSEQFTYNIGWKDLINEVQFDVDQRAPSALPEEIYNSPDTIYVSPGQIVEVKIPANEPFYDAITPVAILPGAVVNEDDMTDNQNDEVDQIIGDYNKTGNVELALGRRSGASTTLTVKGGVGGGTVSNLRIRATTVPVSSTLTVSIKDPGSIDKHKKKSYTEVPPWLNVHDALAVAQVLLGLRAERLPVITFTLKNETEDRLREILQRQLSDRVNIFESETFTEGDHFLEKIEHEVSGAGHYHTATFSFEKARHQPDNVFTFDDSTRGFDDGFFGYTGIDDPTKVFILNQSNLDEGLLGH